MHHHPGQGGLDLSQPLSCTQTPLQRPLGAAFFHSQARAGQQLPKLQIPGSVPRASVSSRCGWGFGACE